MRFGFYALCLLATSACGADGGGPEAAGRACGLVAASVEPIFYGGETSSYLRLDAADVSSVGLLLGESGFVCTFVLLGPRLAVTARHCLDESTRLEARVLHEGVESSFEPIELWRHPELDIGVFRLAHDAPVEGIRPWDDDEPSVLAPETRLEVAGVGLNELGLAGLRRFLTGAVVDFDDESVRLSSAGLAGACSGDSGAPLLARSAKDGRPRVLGILTAGDASCKGVDEFVRISALRAAVEPSELARPSSVCGRIDPLGTCLGSTNVWCEGDRLNAARCETPARCVWTEGAGYRCGDAATSPCEDADEWGSCSADGVARCEQGRLLFEACAACERCVTVPATARAACEPG